MPYGEPGVGNGQFVSPKSRNYFKYNGSLNESTKGVYCAGSFVNFWIGNVNDEQSTCIKTVDSHVKVLKMRR